MAIIADDMFGEDSDSFGLGVGAGPGRLGQVIRLNPRTGQRNLDELTWGLQPEHSNGVPGPIHARAETVAGLPLFAEAFRHRRAIVPAAEYNQRRTIPELGQRYGISRRDGQPMAIAGLWEAFRRPDGEVVRSYCIITVPAAGAIAALHDRMPLVLDERDWPVWLGELPGDPAALLHPPADDMLALRPLPGRRSARAAVHRRKAIRV